MNRISLITLAVLLVSAACSKRVARPDDSLEVAPMASASSAAAVGSSSAASEASALEARPSGERPLSLPTVYFEFDSFVIPAPAREALEAFVRDYRATAGPLKVVIAGHTDERGTEEYNLLLGERRASAVRTYLSRLGLDGKALATVSYGEARPAKTGRGEDAWSLNRRAELTAVEAR